MCTWSLITQALLHLLGYRSVLEDSLKKADNFTKGLSGLPPVEVELRVVGATSSIKSLTELGHNCFRWK